jgi:2-polyprenyl-3-methyl-5-hydroxy-6-metoxy-1,4-benzoquinol methylase
MMPNPPEETSPALFFETVNAYQRTQALKAAVDLGLFTAIGEGNHTSQALAKKCEASERGLRILCDYLVVIGFLTKQAHQYDLTADSAVFLDQRSPGYLGGTIKFLLSPMLTDGFQDLAAAVRKGGTAMTEKGTLAPEHPVWVQFARAMAAMAALPAQLIVDLVHLGPDRNIKVLDIAAGHGLFGIAVAKRYPKATVIALDWPNVLEVAQENARKAGVSNRHGTIPGSAFETEFGSDYDLVLLTNFLHHFDVPTCETLLKRVHAALADDGKAVTLDFVPNEDRISPPIAASFSLMMLGSTPSGDAYTFSELESMFKNAGFSRNELHPLPPTFLQVVVSHKR